MQVFNQKLIMLRFLNNVSLILNYEIKCCLNFSKTPYTLLRRKIDLLNYITYIRNNISNFILKANSEKHTFLKFVLFSNSFVIPYTKQVLLNSNSFLRFFYLPLKKYNNKFEKLFLFKYKKRFKLSFFNLFLFWFIIFFSDFLFYTLKSYFLFWLRKVFFFKKTYYYYNIQPVLDYKQFYLCKDVACVYGLFKNTLSSYFRFNFKVLIVVKKRKQRKLPKQLAKRLAKPKKKKKIIRPNIFYVLRFTRPFIKLFKVTPKAQNSLFWLV